MFRAQFLLDGGAKLLFEEKLEAAVVSADYEMDFMEISLPVINGIK